ncbi:hypothetical protein [Prochlorococcus marinus]|uniref:hypothetical protein n=1 Tax=Prochlorococcus marinus TaxID=1219 RepID=UPI0022B40BA8|nr:hypothetical protein [Prochlorococcus marinus]
MIDLKKNFLPVICMLSSFLLTQACADSEWGKKLSNSFDTPIEVTSNSKPTVDRQNQNLTSNNKVLKKANGKQGFSRNILTAEKITSEKDKPVKAKVQKATKIKNKRFNYKPQPYRIIIRLSGSDPSAPAEALTRALRDAGVMFEVERIERFDNSSSPLNLKSIKR